jgi:type III secretory pathway component EscR
MNTIRKMPLRKILAIWAATLTSFVVIYCVVKNAVLSQQVKDIITYIVSITIGAYFASSSYEAVRKGKEENDKQA